MAKRDETPEPGDGTGAEANEIPVHYQISFTNRQAGTFFFSLLVALGLAFFFGMKTGAAARRGFDPTSRSASFDVSPTAALTPEEKGDKGQVSGSSPTRSAPVAAAETGDKKLGFEESPHATPRPVETPRAESTPTPVAASPTPTTVPAVAAVPTAAAGPAADKGAKPAKVAAPYFVQLLATHNTKMADDLVKKLKSQGFKADVSSAPKQPDLFRVRVGPYADRAKAEAGKIKIKKANPTIKNPVVAP